MATRTIYLVRHAQFVSDKQSSRFQSLTPQGVKQAKLTAKRFRSMPITALYSSDLPRAVETAEIIHRELDGIPYKKRRNLRERFFGIPSDMKDSPDFFNISPETIRKAIRESEQTAASVFEQHFRPTRGQDKHDVIVSHGNLIRYLIFRLLLHSGDGFLRMGTDHCGVSEVLVRSDRRIQVISYNGVGHMPYELLS